MHDIHALALYPGALVHKTMALLIQEGEAAMEHGVCLRMQHQREGAVLHMCTNPQTHFMTITSRETCRTMLTTLHTLNVFIAVIVGHLGIFMDAAGSQYNALGCAEQPQFAFTLGENTSNAAVLHQQFLCFSVEEVGCRVLVLIGVLAILKQDVGGCKITALLVEFMLTYVDEHMVVVGFRDDGIGSVCAERYRYDTKFRTFVNQPVAGFRGVVEPHGDQRFIDTTAAALDPNVLMLHNIGQMRQLALVYQGLNVLGVGHANTTTLTMDDVLCFNNNDFAAIFNTGTSSCTTCIAGTHHNDLAGNYLNCIGHLILIRIRKETGLAGLNCGLFGRSAGNRSTGSRDGSSRRSGAACSSVAASSHTQSSSTQCAYSGALKERSARKF